MITFLSQMFVGYLEVNPPRLSSAQHWIQLVQLDSVTFHLAFILLGPADSPKPEDLGLAITCNVSRGSRAEERTVNDFHLLTDFLPKPLVEPRLASLQQTHTLGLQSDGRRCGSKRGKTLRGIMRTIVQLPKEYKPRDGSKQALCWGGTQEDGKSCERSTWMPVCKHASLCSSWVHVLT